MPKTVLITGAAGSLGAAMVSRFAGNGYSLALTDVDSKLPALETLARQTAEQFGVRVDHFAVDLLDYDKLAERLSGFAADHGIEVLVNNAGMNMLVPSLELQAGQWDQIVDLNLKSCFFVAQAIAKTMLVHGGGSIVNIASQHGVVGNTHRAAYCASKGGLISLTRALAVEWAKYGIRVNAVSPTFVASEQNQEIVGDPSFKRLNLPKIPLGRFATAEDVADAVYFLGSNSSSMITGQNLLVDGGWTAQ